MPCADLAERLVARQNSGKSVRIGLVGAGKFGTMFLAQARTTVGLQPSVVVDLDCSRAVAALDRVGWPADQVVTASTAGELADVAARGGVGVTDNVAAAIDSGIDVLVESTGNVSAAARHAVAAFESGVHVVMVTVEADVLVGLALARRAASAGVVYSMAYGDQPALICEMVDWARCCGFSVTAAGKGTRHLPIFHESTPETVFDHYGAEAESLKRDAVNPRMFNSFLDGTKSSIEMAAVSNATGLVPPEFGLQFPAIGTNRLAEMLKPKDEGGLLERAGTVEVVSCLETDGTAVDNDLRWGVYVVVEAEHEYVRECFRQYGIPSDASGRYGAAWRPNHWIGLELGPSIAAAAIDGRAIGVAGQHVAEVVGCTKSDLLAGQVIDGEGGHCVWGRLTTSAAAQQRSEVPLGLLEGARLIRDVPRGAVITSADVELDADPLLVDLRAETLLSG
ncbi:MAG: flagellar biosynthesis protein FlgA [Planctomycetota bacterium]|nr:flagellar biosynthesis protein FlgA [Planctomycetota bacterium]